MDVTQSILSEITTYMKYAKFRPESRRREKFRLKVAQKHITNWYNEY